MKPTRTPALFATSLMLALLVNTAQAELVSQSVREDAIVPEANGETVVTVRNKPQAAPVAPAQSQVTQVQQVQVAQAPAKPSVGSTLDQGIQNKMDDVKTQFENALLKTLDRIKITVEEPAAAPATVAAGAAGAASTQGATVNASGVNGPVNTTIVQDSLTNAQSAPAGGDAYMPVGASSIVDDEAEDADGVSLADADEKPKASIAQRVRIAPIFGRTMINSNLYNIDSRYTAGFEIEMDIDTNFAAVLGYSYSQYDIGLGAANPFYQQYGGFGTTQLGYNQNLFSGSMRAYLMPPESKFRVFGGAGVGYNLGYLNYRQNAYNGYTLNPYYGSTFSMPDYEVKSWLGLLEAGAAFNISSSVSLGAIFKYALVFSSTQNQPLNNYAFVNGGGYTSYDQNVVGGSLQKDSFYSILGTIKVSF